MYQGAPSHGILVEDPKVKIYIHSYINKGGLLEPRWEGMEDSAGLFDANRMGSLSFSWMEVSE